MTFIWAAAAWLAVVNTIAFFMMMWDKRQARRGGRRTPERTLFLSALLGGSIGAIIGMRLFRHKTRHPAFSIGLPFILFVQVALAFLGVWFFFFKG